MKMRQRPCRSLRTGARSRRPTFASISFPATRNCTFRGRRPRTSVSTFPTSGSTSVWPVTRPSSVIANTSTLRATTISISAYTTPSRGRPERPTTATRLERAPKQAIARHARRAPAAALVSGERPYQRALERALAEMHGVEECAVFVSGWATNVTTLGHLFREKDLILHDAGIHNSVLQGALLSGARRITFPHNDWQALDGILRRARPTHERAVILIHA